MRSPKLAAMGVATLSGLTPVFFEPTITPTMMIPEHDTNGTNTWLQTSEKCPSFATAIPLILTCCDQLCACVCVCLPCSREAMKAVATLLEQSSTAWLIWNVPSGIHPRITAATAARNPTTVACTWRRGAQFTTLFYWLLKKTTTGLYEPDSTWHQVLVSPLHNTFSRSHVFRDIVY